MGGLELSRSFYYEYGKPMLENEFGQYIDRIAVGLVGHGSECFGYDDEISTDHDFEPGFCIWLTDEDEREFGFKLFRAYSKLPTEYKGIKCEKKSLGGTTHHGVHTIAEFYSAYTGRSGAPESWQDWLYTPSHYFAEATNGEVFADPLGEFTRIREEILAGMPEDVRLKKIACCALHMAQSGQYNYKRCVSHGETAAARLALDEFVRYGSELLFLLEKRHMPYYKWTFKAMRSLPHLSLTAKKLEELILLPADETLRIELLIEDICAGSVAEIKKQLLIGSIGDYLEPYAYAINDKIINSDVRNLHIYYNTP